MADISVKAKLDELGIQLQGLGAEVVDGLVATAAKMSELAYNRAVEMTQDRLHSTRQQYIDALQLSQEGPGVFVVSLAEEAEKWEEGFPPFPMLPKLAQGPKSKVAKDGHRYTVIPLRQNVGEEMMLPKTSGPGGAPDMVAAIKNIVDERKFKQVKAEQSKQTGKFTTVERYTGEIHPALKGLTRIREYKGADKDESPISSAYFIFRVASEKQDPNTHWKHPGFEGANIFPDLERWADEQLGQIVKEFFG